MTGKKIIIVNVENSYQFHEHALLEDAKAEAHRLARSVRGKFVIYAPIMVVERAPETTETLIAPEGMFSHFRTAMVADDDDLPF
jgi:hypothetical protein